MEYIIHFANVLYLVSYLVKDILWLRILTVVAIFCLLPYFYFQPQPLMAAIAWNIGFAVINIFRICLLLLERRPVKLGEDDQKLYSASFRCLTPREYLNLLSFASWKEAKPLQQIIEKGKTPDQLMVIFSGRLSVEKDGKKVAELSDGQFFGEIHFITGEKDGKKVAELSDGQFFGEIHFITGEKAPISVIAEEVTRYVSWPKKELSEFLEKHLELREAFQYTLEEDLVRKLKSQY